MADSAAAIVKMKITKIWPVISSRYIDKAAKFKLIDNNRISIDNIIIIMFFRFITMPIKPILNSIEVNAMR